MDALSARPELRVVLLKGNGRHFQAGADLAWCAPSRAPRRGRTCAQPRHSRAVDRLNRLPVPTVALVQGGCFGGRAPASSPPATW